MAELPRSARVHAPVAIRRSEDAPLDLLRQIARRTAPLSLCSAPSVHRARRLLRVAHAARVRRNRGDLHIRSFIAKGRAALRKWRLHFIEQSKGTDRLANGV